MAAPTSSPTRIRGCAPTWRSTVSPWTTSSRWPPATTSSSTRESCRERRDRVRPAVQDASRPRVAARWPRRRLVHTPRTARDRAGRAREGRLGRRPCRTCSRLLLRVERAHASGANVGYVNKAANPSYRVFITDGELAMENLSNHFTEGTALAVLTGSSWGAGPRWLARRSARRPSGPDFDIDVRIEDTADARHERPLARAREVRRHGRMVLLLLPAPYQGPPDRRVREAALPRHGRLRRAPGPSTRTCSGSSTRACSAAWRSCWRTRRGTRSRRRPP